MKTVEENKNRTVFNQIGIMSIGRINSTTPAFPCYNTFHHVHPPSHALMLGFEIYDTAKEILAYNIPQSVHHFEHILLYYLVSGTCEVYLWFHILI